jgi:hypothetical protein
MNPTGVDKDRFSLDYSAMPCAPAFAAPLSRLRGFCYSIRACSW